MRIYVYGMHESLHPRMSPVEGGRVGGGCGMHATGRHHWRTLDPGVLESRERTLVSISPSVCGDSLCGGVRFVGANAYWCTRDMCPPLIYTYI